VAIVDQVRRAQAPTQRTGQSQPIDREQLRQDIAERGRRAGPLPLQPLGVLLELGHAFGRLQPEHRP
jgi:hypothetical protein